MLAADHVGFEYGSASVLEDVSVHIAPGSVVGILGPNGSGKTTLLKILSGGLQPARGNVSMDGRSLADLSTRTIARRIAVVPQETHPAFDYTAMDITLMGRYPWLGPFQIEGPDDVQAARRALAATGTAHLENRAFPTLSGGEKQRVVIASALAQLDHHSADASTRAFLILDEPTTSLDLRYQIEVASLIERLHREVGVTILLSTHDLRLAAAVCSHLVLLSCGRVLGHGPTRDMLTADRISALYSVDRAAVVPLLP